MTNKEELLQMINQLNEVDATEEDLQFILKHLDNKNSSEPNELYCELTIQGNPFTLTDLTGQTTNQIFSDFKEFLSVYFNFILQKNREKQNNILSRIQITPPVPNSDTHPEAKTEINPETNSKISLETQILNLVVEASTGTIFNTLEIQNMFKNDTVELSAIHEALRYLVEKDILYVTHFVHCHRCNNHYGEHLTKLPPNIYCPYCHSEALSIDLHYVKK